MSGGGEGINAHAHDLGAGPEKLVLQLREGLKLPTSATGECQDVERQHHRPATCVARQAKLLAARVAEAEVGRRVANLHGHAQCPAASRTTRCSACSVESSCSPTACSKACGGSSWPAASRVTSCASTSAAAGIGGSTSGLFRPRSRRYR